VKKLLFILLLVTPTLVWAQKTAIVKGVVKNADNKSLANVNISFNKTGTTTNSKGFYEIRIPLHQEVKITFSHVGYKKETQTFYTTKRKVIRNTVVLHPNNKLDEIVIKDNTKSQQGIVSLDAKKINNLPSANKSVESLLMTLPGVSNNNELSTQYNVRGGNFDENLVYVNGIEVYRPFLVRSGQQEGLSFVNTDMVQNISFSAGGFQAKYGDKLSSVLDITYKKPTEFGLQIEASLLGASATFENTYAKDKLSVLVGARYRNNNLFVSSKQIESNYKPQFSDVQTYLSYQISDKFALNFLGTFSLNNYNYTPYNRRTRFGTIANPIELIVFYEGQEKDTYLTAFGAISGEYKLNDNTTLTTTVSSYNTQEEEYFDIGATYNLGEVDGDLGSNNFGEVSYVNKIGSQLNHSRNDLDALISNIQTRISYKKENHSFEAGIKFQHEDIKDRIREWEMIDSVGFVIRPPHVSIINEQPYIPYTGPIVPFQSIRADNSLQINRLMGFAQYSKKVLINSHELWYNLGVRSQFWSVKSNGNESSQTVISPRAQISLKPNWEKDMLFRFSTGLYHQPPFYKELRRFDGRIDVAIKAQTSVHAVLGWDYSFTMWERPFKLTSELYYKNLSNVNPYVVDNVRIRYQGHNDAKAYVMGFDVRLNGEFVPGNDSWISLGVLKTEENIANQGYIARPTDQRFKVGMLFQDYVPSMPNLKAYLNLVYNKGLPGGAPAYANPYDYQHRLRDYKRADLGILYVIKDRNKKKAKGLFSQFKEANIGLELFNIFNIQNTITNTWVRDIATKNQYAVPNYLSSRILNLKLQFKL